MNISKGWETALALIGIVLFAYLAGTDHEALIEQWRAVQ